MDTFYRTTTQHPGPIKQTEIIIVTEEAVFIQTLAVVTKETIFIQTLAVLPPTSIIFGTKNCDTEV